MIGGGVLELLEQGGTVMLPLLLCSVVAVAIVLERVWTLTREGRSARHVHALVYQTLAGAGRTAALAVCQHDPSPLASIYRVALACAGNDAVRRDVSERKLAQVVRPFSRFVWLLGTIGSLAPFIGLLGTVIGIIRAFENMAATGSGGFAVVAAGISEALVATAGGLLVGVISILAYNALAVRIKNLVAELREHTDELLAAMSFAAAGEGARPRVAESR
jgi:biopolymer transport protein ExbB